MKLHEAESPNARRVHVFMAEKGIDLPRVAVDIRADIQVIAHADLDQGRPSGRSAEELPSRLAETRQRARRLRRRLGRWSEVYEPGGLPRRSVHDRA